MRTHELYRRAADADAAYHEALIDRYGRAAGDARYDLARNQVTPELAALREAKITADAAYLAACEASRR